MERNYDGPTLIIKTAWRGKSFHNEYRSPSADEYEVVEKFREKGVLQAKQAEVKEFSGTYYRYVIEHVRKVLSNSRRTLICFATSFAMFVKNLNTPELPFVIGVIGINGNHTPGLFSGPSNAQQKMQRLNKAMAAPARLQQQSIHG